MEPEHECLNHPGRSCVSSGSGQEHGWSGLFSRRLTPGEWDDYIKLPEDEKWDDDKEDYTPEKVEAAMKKIVPDITLEVTHRW